MRTTHRLWTFRSLWLLLLVATSWRCCACTIPVFRYALERWQPEIYRAHIFSHGSLPADGQSLLKSLRDMPANLSITLVDVDKPDSPDALKLWKAQGSPALPWLAVSFPEGKPSGAGTTDGTLAWSGALDAAGIADLLDSPARKQLRQHLLSGTSVVWVLLESGEAERDEKVVSFLQKQSAELAKKLKLPHVEPGVNESQLLSGLALKLEFSIVRVARSAPEEKFFAALLQQSELFPQPSNRERAEPLVFPVFGRGRALPALTEKDLLPELRAQKDCCPNIAGDVSPATLSDAALFVTGMCSCDIKSLTPGADLLIAADWETELMTGKNQCKFLGTFAKLSEDSQKLGPEVIGSFNTSSTDKKPGRTYLVKVENDNKAVLATLERYDGKNAQVAGKLQDIGPDGEAKYLIVSAVIEASSTPRAKEHRKAGGL
jgi:hypothetical protein